MSRETLKTYRVRYVVTLTEWYEVEATSPDDAEERAYCEGVLVEPCGKPCDRGECHDVVPGGTVIAVTTGGAR